MARARGQQDSVQDVREPWGSPKQAVRFLRITALSLNKNRFRKLFVILAFNVSVASLLFVLCEFVVRWAAPFILPQHTDRQLFQDNVYGTSEGLRPLAVGYSNGAEVRVDKYGFRSCSIPVDTSKRSWLLIGDSVTEGIGVAADSTFAGILQKHSDIINVLNASVVGHDLTDYENVVNALIVDKRHKLKIDRVTLLYCLNDIYRGISEFDTPGGSLRSVFGDALRYVRSHSRFYLLIKALLFDRARSYYEFDRKFYTPNTEDFKLATDAIVGINSTCRQQGVAFEVVLLPYEFQVRSGTEDLFFPQNILTASLESSGVTVFDPSGYMLNAVQDSDELYLFGDGIHFSATGHGQIARYLLATLSDPSRSL